MHFLVPVGTTGEAPTLSAAEKRVVVEIVVDEARGVVPVLAGAGGYDTAEVIESAHAMAEAGANGILSVSPYYNKPTQEGLYRHFRTIAEKGDLPLILYNVPGRTVADLANDTVLRLAQVPGIVGIKDATADLARGSELLRGLAAAGKTDFAVYSGDDITALPLIFMGAHGVISVTANVAPKLMAEMCAAALAGDCARARAANDRLLPLHRQLFIEANPIPVKWALAEMGLIRGEMRLPLTRLAAQHHDAVRAALRAAGCT
jgi:4-hydroxy-tetrahydrodipicolinate synthase